MRPFAALLPAVFGSLAAMGTSSSSPPAGPSVANCLAERSPETRAACVERRLASGSTEEDRRALRGLIPSEAAAVERWARAGAAAARGDAPRAGWIDLRGQALAALDRKVEAADAYAAAVALDDGASRIRWVGGDGEERWSAVLDAGPGRLERAARAAADAGRPEAARSFAARALALGASPAFRDEAARRLGVELPAAVGAVLVPRSFPAAPDLRIEPLDGDPVTLASLRGRVVLLDFWASWCAPCIEELPHLQRLFAAERDRGLTAFAVNMREGTSAAREGARSLGLTVPLARYTEALDGLLAVRTLPAVLLVDREGRLRGRWDGYRRGLEATIAARVRSLLGDDPEAAPVKLADVVRGAGALRVVGAADLAAPATGLAPAAAPGGARALAVAAGGNLLLLDVHGAVLDTQPLSTGVGRLVPLPASPGGASLVGYRAGGGAIVAIDTQRRSARPLEAGAPVLGVAPAAAAAAGGAPRLAVAAVDGARWLDLGDGSATRASLDGEVLDVAADVAGGRVAWLAQGRVRWTGADGRATGETAAPAEAARLVPPVEAGGPIGLAPSWLTATAGGRLARAAGRWLALATASGQLVVLDPASGRETFRADWPGIVDLAAADVDGDGADELAVASGRSVVVLAVTTPVP